MKAMKRIRRFASTLSAGSRLVTVCLAGCTTEGASDSVRGDELDATSEPNPKPEPSPDEPKPDPITPEPPCDDGELHGRLYDADRKCFDYHDDEAERRACVDEKVIESCGDDALFAVVTSSGECWQLPFVCYTLPDGWTAAKGEGCADAPECSSGPDSEPEPEPPVDAGGDTPSPSDACSDGFAMLNGRAFDTTRRCFDFADGAAQRGACVRTVALDSCGDDVPMPVISPEGECWLLSFTCHTYPEGWSSADAHACARAAECDEAQAWDSGAEEAGPDAD